MKSNSWLRVSGTCFLTIAAVLNIGNVECSAKISRKKSSSSNVSKSLNLLEPIETETSLIRYKTALWFTNRQVNSVAGSARPRTSPQKTFLAEQGSELYSGWMKISYPAGRKVGNQNYSDESDKKDILKNFAIVDYDFFSTRGGAKRYFDTLSSEANSYPILYVHGYDHSFSSASERLAQISLDLEDTNVPIIFSWPSDINESSNLLGILFGMTGRYGDAYKTSVKSRSHLANTIKVSSSFSPGRLVLLAHSMGSDVSLATLSNLHQEQKLFETSFAAVKPQSFLPRLAIFAAPDIGVNNESSNAIKSIKETSTNITFYCAQDVALKASKVINNSDGRLGYCKDYESFMDGLDFVKVRGTFVRESHSYYLTEPLIISDMKAIIKSSFITTENVAKKSIHRVRDIDLR